MAFFHRNLSTFPLNAAEMDARLRARLSPWEFFALVLAFSATGIFLWVQNQFDIVPFDYDIYWRAAQGDLVQFYYADWIRPLFWLWAKLPYDAGYIAWAVLNILCVFLAARTFGGNKPLVLLTFQVFCAAFTGQITGLLVGGLALGWWGMAHKRWHLAGLGFFVAGAKFQIGLPFGLLLWLFADVTWRQRLRVLVLPALLALLSLLVFPAWPLDLLERMKSIPPYDWGSITFWRWLGAAALLLWLPPLLLPIERPKRFLSLAAAIPLTMPYFQQADLLALFVLPVGWLPILLGNVGFLFFEYQFAALRLLWIAPLTVYLSISLPAACAWLRNLRFAAQPGRNGRQP